MNICRILSFTYFAGLLLLCLHTISGEYNIMDVVPSYMYRKYDNVAEEIFPEEIRIKVSLSKISGTLLYSIDKHMNQLIVSLHYSIQATIEIEFRKVTNSIFLSDLCECENCQYEMLEFFIEIKDTVNLQCNGRAVRKYKYNEAKEVNSEYPLPYSDLKVYPGSPNEAHLWLVNTPYYKDLYPNQAQMLGCIFQVKYKGQPIKFTEITDKIEQKCRRKCVDNICNGGTCHETYNGRAICNCTETFLNGPYCNEKLSSINLRSRKVSLKFTLLKVSWKSRSKNLLSLSNKNTYFSVTSSGDNLLFEVKYLKDFEIIRKGIILNGYVPNIESILLTRLFEKNIYIKFFNGRIWHFRNITSIPDLRSETFTDLTLRSEEGMLGLAYKPLSINHKWRNVKIEKYEEIKNNFFQIKRNLSQNITTSTFHTTTFIMTKYKTEDALTSKIAIIFIFLGLHLAEIGILIYVCLLFRRRRTLRQSYPDQEHLLLHEKNNVISLKSIIENFSNMENIKFKREGLTSQLKEYKGRIINPNDKDSLLKLLPEFLKLDCLDWEKNELFDVLQDEKKFEFTEKEKNIIKHHLKDSDLKSKV